ncbi:MAG: HAD family phosphatase [Clostridia bacterium]|nr:HAD family phosphatase [Clostridia bacterium]
MNPAQRYDLAYETMPWDDVDAVIFDIGNVLIYYAPDDFLLRLFPGDEKKQKDMLAQVYLGKYWPMFDRGTMEYEEAARLLHEEYGYPVEDYLHALRGWIELKSPIEEGWRAVRLCKEKGKRLYLLSCYPREGYERMREKFAERFDLFDGGVISCYCHYNKPEDEIYREIKRTCGLTEGRCVFIDDTLINVEGAIKNGIHGFHMHEKGMMDRFFI